MKPNQVLAKETVIDRFIHHWLHDQSSSCIWGLMSMDAPLSYEIIEKTVELLIKNRED
jgi:hypothetical protein